MKNYNVTITETLRMTVEVEANNRQEAERIVADNWRSGDYILDADSFTGVSFKASMPERSIER